LWDAGDIGSGATVALYELEPFSQSDVTAYDSCYGVSPSVTVTRVAGGAGTGAGTGEAALDVEDVAGLAPGASIDVYEGPNNGEGPLAVDETIVSADTARIVSTSWGACEAANGAGFAEEENTLFEEAATQGQTVFAAAGDSGSDDCGTSGPSPAVDDPASQPDVTGVGGTSLAGTYAQPADETVWNDARGAGGGGMSSLWASPSYQSGLGASMREVPDVSADADPATGYAIDYKSRWLDFGGTSAAAPTWAALTALAERSSACASDTSGLGLINDALYTLPESDFDDVTSGNNGYGGVPGYPAGPGYDMASGLGAPNGSALVPALCAKGAGAAVDDPTATATVTATSTTTTTTTTATTGTAPPTGPGAPPTTTVTPPAPNPPGSTTTGAGPRHPAPAIVDFSAPARLRVTVGVRVRERLHAADRDGLRLTYSAVRLPPGLRISRATGVVSGRPRRAGTYTASVRAVDARGDGRSVVIRWVVRRAARARRR
jgi:subtilase family serine protease